MADQAFDLTKEGPKWRRAWLLGRYCALGFVAAVAVVLVVILVPLEASHGWGAERIALIAGLVWVDGLFGWTAVFGFPVPPTWVEVSDDGIRFRFGSSRYRDQPWPSGREYFRLYETDGVRDLVSRGKAAYACNVGNHAFGAVLSRPAFEAIMATAAERGYSVTKSVSRRPGWTRIDLSPAETVARRRHVQARWES
jgi:hypothetical protein